MNRDKKYRIRAVVFLTVATAAVAFGEYLPAGMGMASSMLGAAGFGWQLALLLNAGRPMSVLDLAPGQPFELLHVNGSTVTIREVETGEHFLVSGFLDAFPDIRLFAWKGKRYVIVERGSERFIREAGRK